MSDFFFQFDQNELIAIGALPAPALAPEHDDEPEEEMPAAPTFRGKVLPPPPPQVGRKGGLSFPLKLHALLNDAVRFGFEDVVSWQPPGAGASYFKVHKPEIFANQIMRSYFNQTKFKSFQRQLNLYGFVRMHQGVFRGCYTHKYFVRGQPSLTRVMQRKKPAHEAIADPVADHGSDPSLLQRIAAADREDEPVLPAPEVKMVPIMVGPQGLAPSVPRLKEDTDNEIRIFEQFFDIAEGYQMEDRDTLSVCETVEDGSDEGYVNLFSDASGNEERDDVPQPDNAPSSSGVLVSNNDSAANASADGSRNVEFTPVRERSFPWKLYEMLHEATESGFTDVVSWDEGGTSFTILDHQSFLSRIMPLYFDQSVFESFRRQLNLYGFSRIGRGKQTSTYFHPCFIRGNREMCRQIVRHAPRQRQTAQVTRRTRSVARRGRAV